MGAGGQGGCEGRIEAFVKIQTKLGVGSRVGLEGQGGCERRIEVFVNIQKNQGVWLGGGSGWGVRVDVNENLKFL